MIAEGKKSINLEKVRHSPLLFLFLYVNLPSNFCVLLPFSLPFGVWHQYPLFSTRI